MGGAGLLGGLIMPSRGMLVRAAAPPGAMGRAFGVVSFGDEELRRIDRLAVDAQQLVRRAVGGGRMRRHTKALRNGLEVFLFFMDAVAGTPPPGLMHKRPVCRIH